jgi:hypothetical protein
MLVWTYAELAQRGKQVIDKDKVMASVGLEVAMSVVQTSSIKQYWEMKPVSGHTDFSDTMSCTEFQNIRAAVQFHLADSFDADTIERDPLYTAMKNNTFRCYKCGVCFHLQCFNKLHH